MRFGFLLKTKDGVAESLQELIQNEADPLGTCIGKVHCDGGAEFKGRFQALCHLWGEAFHTAVYLKNRTPTEVLGGKSPLEVWQGKPLGDMSHILEWGSIAYKHEEARFRNTKLSARAKKMYHVGYNTKNRTYRLWEPAEPLKITNSAEVSFREKETRDVVKRKEGYDSFSAMTPTTIYLPDTVDTSEEENKKEEGEEVAEEVTPTPSGPQMEDSNSLRCSWVYGHGGYITRSMHGGCFRCGEKGDQSAACTKPEPLRCEKCLGYGHDKSKCSSEQAVLAVELPVLDATALDVEEEALVVRDFTGEWNRVVDRGGVEQARQERFVADTGATNHMFPSANAFENYHECDRRLSVAAGKQAFAIVGYGDVRVTIGSRVGTTDLLLKRVAHVPELIYNLVSLTALLKQTKGRLAADERELEVFVGGGESVYFPLWGDLFVQTGHRIDSGRELACAIIAPGNAKANRTPVDINDFHCAHGHSHEVLLKNTAKQQGVTRSGTVPEHQQRSTVSQCQSSDHCDFLHSTNSRDDYLN
ncbi:unnamed protein product [Ectocarpus sp. CCAP 1310/34]|nr:unnamed protein product [Ectocarpus sp. CCAP 1310/34]